MSESLGAAVGSRGDRWAHQDVAVAAIETVLRDGGRATAESACGSGKSRIAARVAVRLAPEGRVLVTVPTLELVAQMLATFAEHGRPLGRVVAVCSDAEVVSVSEVDLDAALDGALDVELGGALGGAAVTTDPQQLAELTHGPGRVTVLCTYQSLQVLAAAHADHGMPAWDLAVIDEAHRTAGRAGRSWALIHDDVVIPAARRLYMTATRKIMGAGGDDLAVSMDDEKIYGPVVFKFTTRDGIERGLLADYQVLVVVVTDQQIRQLATTDDQHLHLGGGAAVSPRMLATQIAVLRAACDYGIRRAITFHNRVADARQWAHTLPHAWQIMPSGDRPPGVVARHIYGGQRISERRKALDHLRQAPPPDPQPTDPQPTDPQPPGPHRAGRTTPGPVHVVCNARVLTEGVDAPAVDGVVFVDPRNSVIDTVQAVGRALRTGGQTGKIARILVPVVLGPDEDPEAALDGSAYAQVWKVIRALRAHDDRLARYLDTARARGVTARAACESPDGDDLVPGQSGLAADWLQVCGTPVPSSFAAAIQVRAVQAASSRWPAVLAAAHAWAAEHPQGLHDIPRAWTHNDVALWAALVQKRRDRRVGVLPADQDAELCALDPTWYLPRRGALLRGARAFYREHGHLLPDPHYRTETGLDLYGWLESLRTRGSRNADPKLRRSLDRIGMIWSKRDAQLAPGVLAARAHAAVHGNLPVASTHVCEHSVCGVDYPLGRFLQELKQSRRDNALRPWVRTALEAIDPGWDRSKAQRREHKLALAAAYVAVHGHLPNGRGNAASPRPGGEDFRPWLAEQRLLARKGRNSGQRINPQVLDRLNALDPNWLDSPSFNRRENK